MLCHLIFCETGVTDDDSAKWCLEDRLLTEVIKAPLSFSLVDFNWINFTKVPIVATRFLSATDEESVEWPVSNPSADSMISNGYMIHR